MAKLDLCCHEFKVSKSWEIVRILSFAWWHSIYFQKFEEQMCPRIFDKMYGYEATTIFKLKAQVIKSDGIWRNFTWNLSCKYGLTFDSISTPNISMIPTMRSVLGSFSFDANSSPSKVALFSSLSWGLGWTWNWGENCKQSAD